MKAKADRRQLNRRHFSRIHFSTPAELSIDNEQYVATVLDISLRGALVQIVQTPAPELTPGATCTLAINLGSESSDELLEGVILLEGSILMKAVIAHIHEDVIGLRCVAIDLDSITSLRSIVEFNLGDEVLLSRELKHLSHSD